LLLKADDASADILFPSVEFGNPGKGAMTAVCSG